MADSIRNVGADLASGAACLRIYMANRHRFFLGFQSEAFIRIPPLHHSSKFNWPFLIVRFWSSVSDRPFLIVRLITNWDDDGRRRRWRRRLDDSSPPSSFISVSVSVRFLPRADPSIWEFFRFVSFAVDSNQLDSWLFYFLFFISFDFVLICLAGRNSWRCRSPAAAATVLPSSGRFRHFIFSSIKSIYRNSSVYEQNFFFVHSSLFYFFHFFSIFLMGFFFFSIKVGIGPRPSGGKFSM